jgi:ATP-binding protein involved in chromosome partitioning
VLQKEIEVRLAEYQDPYLQTDFFKANVARKVVITQDHIQIDVRLGYAHAYIKTEIIAALSAWLAPVTGGKTLNIHLTQRIEAHAGKQNVAGLSQVKNMIAVASGKGGVGKSTIAVNLALALAQDGARVGILDADIYGPSQPAMLGTQGERPTLKDTQLQPILRHGIQSMSMGYLIDAKAAMVWRGPMIGKAMQQMVQDTAWDALDYMIVDLPPGTGDIQLTLCQKMPVCGAVMVTTPQEVALMDVRRACAMFEQLNVPILGVVENMSTHQCTQCGHEEPIFGVEGAARLAAEHKVSVLQTIPLHKSIREMTDAGFPPVLQAPHSLHAKAFMEMGRKISAALSLQAKDYSSKFPTVVVEKGVAP